MGSRRIDLPRFTKGIISDASGVEGAFERADNIVPRGAGVWGCRGSKFLLGRWSGMATLTGMAYLASEFPTRPYLAQGYTAGSVRQWFAMDAATGNKVGPLEAEYPLSTAAAAVTLPGLTSSNWPELARNAMPTTFADELLLPGGLPALGVSAGIVSTPMKWAGSQLVAAYNFGTVSGTSGSRTLTAGGGAVFPSNVLNAYVWIDSPTVRNRAFRITRFVSAGVLEVDAGFDVTFAGASFVITAMAHWGAAPGIFGGGYTGAAVAVTERAYVNARFVCAHRGRVFALTTIEGDLSSRPFRLRWSGAQGEVSGQYIGAEHWHANGYSDVDGVGTPSALASDGEYLYVITTSGVWAFVGDVETDGRDVGAQFVRVLDTDGHWGANVASSRLGVLMPGREGLWVLQGGRARNLSADTGTKRMWDAMFVGYTLPTTAGGDVAVGSDGRRILACGLDGVATRPAEGNVAAYYIDENVWVTQSTVQCLPPVGPDGYGANQELTPGGEAGYAFLWRADDEFQNSQEFGATITCNVLSHSIELPDAARVRAIRAHVLSEVALTPFVESGVAQTHWFGNFGTYPAPEEKFTADASDPRSTGGQWIRMALRVGTPPLSAVRVGFSAVAASDYDFRLYRLGVEVAPVGRIRS